MQAKMSNNSLEQPEEEEEERSYENCNQSAQHSMTIPQELINMADLEATIRERFIESIAAKLAQTKDPVNPLTVELLVVINKELEQLTLSIDRQTKLLEAYKQLILKAQEMTASFA